MLFMAQQTHLFYVCIYLTSLNSHKFHSVRYFFSPLSCINRCLLRCSDFRIHFAIVNEMEWIEISFQTPMKSIQSYAPRVLIQTVLFCVFGLFRWQIRYNLFIWLVKKRLTHVVDTFSHFLHKIHQMPRN